jgi:hypothetical protein
MLNGYQATISDMCRSAAAAKDAAEIAGKVDLDDDIVPRDMRRCVNAWLAYLVS